jgi:hypothetical protein
MTSLINYGLQHNKLYNDWRLVAIHGDIILIRIKPSLILISQRVIFLLSIQTQSQLINQELIMTVVHKNKYLKTTIHVYTIYNIYDYIIINN